MSHDTALLLIGAGIALISSIFTALIQHWLQLRVERTKKTLERIEREYQELRDRIMEGSQIDLTLFSQKILESKYRPKVFHGVSKQDSNMDANRACFITGEPISSCHCVNCQKTRMQSTNKLKSSERIEVHFTHPRHAQPFTAEIDPNCTGQVALRGLIAGDERGPFLDPPQIGRPYELALKRNQQLIHPNMTFAEAGVVNGDVIEVLQAVQGAGPDWSEIAQVTFWSAATGLAFLKAVTPILLEILKNKGSRSITIKKGENQITITGDNNIEEVIEALKTLEGNIPDTKQQTTIDQKDSGEQITVSSTPKDSIVKNGP